MSDRSRRPAQRAAPAPVRSAPRPAPAQSNSAAQDRLRPKAAPSGSRGGGGFTAPSTMGPTVHLPDHLMPGGGPTTMFA